MTPSALRTGPLYLNEIFYILGYLAFSAWLWSLSWHIVRTGAIVVLLDATAATAGMFLALWSLLGVVGRQRSGWTEVWVVYPVLDVLALALVLHLAFRIPRRARAWRWVVGAIGLQLVLDLTFLVLQLTTRAWPPSTFTGLYLFTWWCLAVAATHPTVVDITGPRGSVVPTVPQRVRPTLIVLAVVPAVGALAFPVHTALDGIVRSFVVGVLIVLLFTRLLWTMSALSRAEAASSHRASHDPLTGLLNRAGLFDALRARTERDALNGDITALLFLDCDDFKHVNDTWGHPAGDSLLRGIAEGLPMAVRHDDVVARNGGDEFVVVATVQDGTQAARVAERIMDFFTTPLRVLPGRTHMVTPSIGVAMTRRGETPPTGKLLEMADIALYEAKNRGGARFVVFDDELSERARDRAAVSDALQTAVADGALTLALQPILTGSSFDELVGWEALARWDDPTLGVIPPGVFIPLAEEHGLIDALGEFVLRQACRELAVLRAQLDAPQAVVSVNVSAPQLSQPCFSAMVAEALADAGLPGEALWLEVTESILLQTNPAVVETIRRVRACGVLVCLDDFGTGFSSFDTFLRMPVDVVKIDRSLVQRLPEHPEAPVQMRAFVELMRTLRIDRILAEGVETPAQEAAVRSVGFRFVQGWLYGRAEPLDTVLAGEHRRSLPA